MENNLLIDWFTTPSKYQSTNDLLYSKDSEKWFIDQFLPFTEEYFSELNPMFSFQRKYFIDSLETKNTIFLRDGLIGLLWFFFTTDPTECEDTIIIHSRFRNFVPDKWKKKIKLYSFINNSKQVLRKNIMITGFFFEEYLSSRFIEKQLNRFSEIIGPHDVEIFAPIKELDTTSHEQYIYFIDCLRKMVGPIKKIWSWNSLVMNPNFNSYSIFDINEGNIISDSYMNHFFNSKKGHVYLDEEIDNPAITSEFQDYKLSYNHSVRVFSNYDFSVDTLPDEYFFHCFEVIEYQFRKREFFPWRDDFFDFVKKHC